MYLLGLDLVSMCFDLDSIFVLLDADAAPYRIAWQLKPVAQRVYAERSQCLARP